MGRDGGMTDVTEQKATGTRIKRRSSARFVGTYTNKIDAKGRVSVPVDFRRYIDPTGDPAAMSPILYCLPAFFGDELQCGGSDLSRIVLKSLPEADVMGISFTAKQRMVTGSIRRLTFDDNGRVIVPKDFRAVAQLATEASFQGCGAYFTVAKPATHLDILALRDSLPEEERAAMAAKMSPLFLDDEEDDDE